MGGNLTTIYESDYGDYDAFEECCANYCIMGNNIKIKCENSKTFNRMCVALTQNTIPYTKRLNKTIVTRITNKNIR